MEKQRLDKGETIKFVRLYKECEVLWNPNDEGYKNREKRIEAYQYIMRNMCKPTLTLELAKKKIKSLRDTYYNEKIKVKRSINSGTGDKPYKPRLAWFDEASFLDDCTPLEDAVPDEENGEFVEILADPNIAFKQDFNSHDPPSRTRRAQSKLPMFKSHTSASMSHEAKKQKLVEEHAPRFTEDKVPKTENLKEHKMDEFYFFAMNVAEQLRALPVEKALKCQFEMQNILLEERLMQECERSNISFAAGESHFSSSR